MRGSMSRVSQVAYEGDHKADESENIERAENHRIVAIDNRLVREEPQPIEGKDGLDEKRVGEKNADKGGG